MRLPHGLRALRHRNFRLFISGQLISLIGTWMQTVAQAWLVYRLTGSALLLGSIGFASQIPVFVLAPLGGVVADRYPRRPILVATQSVMMVLAFLLAALTLRGHVAVWHVFVLAAGLGVASAFDIPARQSFFVQMVGKDDLMNAIALNSSMFNGARIVGPAVAGIVVAEIGEGWCFFTNGVSFLAVIAGLLMMRVAHTAPPPSPARSPLHDILEGFRFVAHTPPIRALLLLLGLVSFLGQPYAVLMPVFADDILHGGPRGLGLLMGATGVGALGGALVLAMRRDVKGLGRWVAAAVILFGAAITAFAMSRVFWLSVLLLLPAGFGMMVQMASCNTLIQAMVPDRLRGRVMALYSMMFMGMAPLGSLLGGALAQAVGAPWTVAAGGLLCIVGTIPYMLHLPRMRTHARELLLAQQALPGAPPDEVGGAPQDT